jgi:hypothetical protein
VAICCTMHAVRLVLVLHVRFVKEHDGVCHSENLDIDGSAWQIWIRARSRSR